MDPGTGSPAGYALLTDTPVISNDLSSEARFRTPEVLRRHGVTSAASVVVRGDGEPFGVLEADSGPERRFTDDDIGFLQTTANLLGLALDRNHRQNQLQQALANRDLLMREADHRIKNSLQLTASLLALHRARLSDAQAGSALDDAIARVRAVATTHHALHESADLHRIDFGQMLRDLCRHVGDLSDSVRITPRIEGRLMLDSERALPLGLTVSELLTNGVRHAYPRGEGVVEIEARQDGEDLVVVVADQGAGFASSGAAPMGLGSSIVRSLSRQIGAALEIESVPQRGTQVTLRLPRRAPGGA